MQMKQKLTTYVDSVKIRVIASSSFAFPQKISNAFDPPLDTHASHT